MTSFGQNVSMVGSADILSNWNASSGNNLSLQWSTNHIWWV